MRLSQLSGTQALSNRLISYFVVAFASLQLIGAPVAYAQFPEGFDDLAVPSLPINWTSTRTGTVNPLNVFWVTENTDVQAGLNAAFVNDPNIVTDTKLDSPTFFNNANDQLTFRHHFNLETGFDGGVLEISINGGAFQDILAAGGSFSAGGYNGTISVNFGNPIGGRQAWTGNQPSYTPVIVNMPAASFNQNVQLRWRRGSDSSVSSTGWFLDTTSLGITTDLGITKTDSVDPVLGGTELAYTITVTNTGPNSATGSIVNDMLPFDMFFTAVDSITQGSFTVPSFNHVVLNFGTLPAGGTASAVVRTGVFNAAKDPGLVTITSPVDLARDYSVRTLSLGAAPSFPGASAEFALVTDIAGDPNDGCDNIVSNLTGKIAVLVNSGLCFLDEAAARAEGGGAIGVVAVFPDFSLQNQPPSGIGVNIPVVAMNFADGAAIISALGVNPVTGSLTSLPGQFLNAAYVSSATADSDSTNNIGFQFTSFLNDTDGDGVSDALDNCDDVDNADQADTDLDGTGDLCDTCTDTDRDGFGDPQFVLNTCPSDGCTADAGKNFPGVCGCGVADTNSDNDSQPDCKDACPTDASKLAAGVCGCGVLDTDLNANGITDCLKTPELRAVLQELQSQLGTLKVQKKGKKGAAQRRLRNEIKDTLSDIQTLIVAGGIQVLDSTQPPADLSAAAAAAVKKALKAKKAFGKNKKAAQAAVAKFLANLAA